MSKHVAFINDRSIKIMIYDFTNSRLFRDFGVTQIGSCDPFFGLGLVTRIYCVPKMFFSRGPCYNGVHFWTWPKTLNPNNILVQTDPPRIQFLNIKLLLIEIELEYSIIYATFTSIYIFNRMKFEKSRCAEVFFSIFPVIID